MKLPENTIYKPEIKVYKGNYLLNSNDPNIIYLRKLSDEETECMKDLGYHVYENPTLNIDIYS